MKPNISVITNFGCNANCWYCIWKQHPLKDVQEEMDWEKLEKFLTEHQSLGKVSVSGGGDCLYQFGEFEEWWNRFFSLTDALGMLVDIHSREKFGKNSFWEKRVNRCVFSSDRLDEDKLYLKYLSDLCKIRIAHVVTKDTTLDMIEEYLEFQKDIGCQFTIKELVGYDDNGMYEKIKETYPEIFFLDSGDYNIYYMPDNTIRDTFLFEEE